MIYGRDRERAQLHELLDDAVAGHGSLVLISGEAGIGKTALVNDLIATAHDQGCLVLSGGCYDLTTTPPYGPWIEALYRSDSPTGELPQIPETMRDEQGLRRLGSQQALFIEVERFQQQVASSTPLVIVLEDLHWSDVSTIEMLRYLARGTSRTPILIACTYRDDEIASGHPLHTHLPALAREAAPERMTLRRLDREALRELVSSSYPLDPTDEQSLLDHMLDRSEGNPLFAVEILRELESSGALHQTGDRWSLVPGFERHFPALLQQMFDLKLARLSSDDRDRLIAASALGQNVSFDLWQQITNVGDDQLAETIGRATSLNILREDDAGTGYTFAHALLREALYSHAQIPQRRRLHLRIAEAMERRPRPDPDEVADHYLLAGDSRAADWLIQAGDRARRRYAWIVAADKYERAIPLLPEDRESARLAGWLYYVVGWLNRVFDHTRSLEALEQARLAGGETGDEVLVACSLGSIGLLRSFTGDLSEGIELMRQGVEQLNELTQGTKQDQFESPPFEIDADDPAVQFPGEGNLSGWLTAAGRIRESIERGEAAAERYDSAIASGTPRTVTTGLDEPPLVALTNAHGLLGNPERASFWADRAKQQHRSTGHHLMVSAAFTVELERVIIPYRTDDINQRNRWSREASAVFRASAGSFSIEQDAAENVSAKLSFIEGEWDRAADWASRFAEIAFEQGIRQTAYATLGWIALHRGNYRDAWEQVERALPPSGLQSEPGTIQYYGMLGLLELASNIALASDDLPCAREAIDTHWRWLNYGEAVFTRSSAHLAEAQYQLSGGDRAQSRTSAERALRRAERPRQPLALLAAHRFLGHLDGLDGRLESANKHLSKAFDLADACLAPFERALTQVEMARLRIAEGDTDGASVLLDAAWRSCKTLHAKPTLDHIEELRQGLGRPVRATSAHGLSARETQVLQAVARGLTNAEIADELFISPRTVGSHITSIYRKLGVSSRSAATRFAIESEFTPLNDVGNTTSNN